MNQPITLAVVVLTAGLASCEQESVSKRRDMTNADTRSTTDTLSRSGEPVRLATVRPVDDASSGVARGYIVPKATATVRAQTSGRLTHVPVTSGDFVVSGTLLATIDSSVLEQDLMSRQATVEESEARQKMEAASLSLAVLDHERAQDLHQRGAITKSELERFASGREASEASHLATQQRVESERSGVKRLEAEMQLFESVAPLSGRIETLHHRSGDYVSEGESLLTVSTDELVVIVLIPPDEERSVESYSFTHADRELTDVSTTHLPIDRRVVRLAGISQSPEYQAYSFIDVDIDPR